MSIEAAGSPEPANHSEDPPRESQHQLDALSDRLREVRRQLTRGRQLANAFDGQRASQDALRAARRLETAVQWLDQAAPPRRLLRGLNESPELPWLVHVVERRAVALERALEDRE